MKEVYALPQDAIGRNTTLRQETLQRDRMRVVQYTRIMRFLAHCIGITKRPPNPNPNQNLTKLQYIKFVGLRGHLVMS